MSHNGVLTPHQCPQVSEEKEEEEDEEEEGKKKNKKRKNKETCPHMAISTSVLFDKSPDSVGGVGALK